LCRFVCTTAASDGPRASLVSVSIDNKFTASSSQSFSYVVSLLLINFWFESMFPFFIHILGNTLYYRLLRAFLVISVKIGIDYSVVCGNMYMIAVLLIMLLYKSGMLSIPLNICDLPSVGFFKRNLKTFYFAAAF